MICWCDEIENYLCFDCESKTTIHKDEDKVLLKTYVSLLKSNRLDLRNKEHKALMIEILNRELNPDQLSNQDVKAL